MTKILLVEDDKSLREIYGVRLLAEGYDIVSAGDGEEALAMAIKERPDLIVSDVMMPKISGFDMLDILRSTTETRDIKVIMMTALSSEDQRARGEALGADRYLVKSQVGIEDVVRTVHDVLGDAPVAPTTAASFNTMPAPSAAPRPAAPMQSMPPRPAPAPNYAPQQSTPVAAPQQQFAPAQPVYAPVAQQQAPQQPAVMQQPTFQPQPAQQPSPAPTPQQFQPAPQPSVMPQPTAPFSTARPANLGDRIIHPIEQQPQTGPDLSSLMDQELHNAMQPTQQPSLQEVSTPTQPNQFVQQTPQPPVPPMPPATPFEQPQTLHGAADIQFEETPRQQPQNTDTAPPVL